MKIKSETRLTLKLPSRGYDSELEIKTINIYLQNRILINNFSNSNLISFCSMTRDTELNYLLFDKRHF